MIRGAGSDNNHGARHEGATNHEESAAVETINQAETTQRGDHHDRGLQRVQEKLRLDARDADGGD